MAVWIQIIGIRKSDSNEIEKEKVRKILNTTELDFDFVKSNYGVEIEKTEWKLVQSKGIEFFELPLLDQSLKVYFDNPNFIEFSGSFGLFSAWFRFADEKQSKLTNGIRKVFGKIAYKYGISELIYFSEWFFSIDYIRNKEANFENLIELIKNNPDLKRNKLYGLEPDEYYVEKTKPSC
ncbi:MAG: hypothetical protein CMC05_03730 [Flavobacteriaceae bacterium]|uniref:hypothetical protein n=1 Tax=Winogradskyella poriferorum TaxID=307627 RepID=UPI000C92C34F|nr:hypothetical protein [Flavobacteriaceae bacterium]|tara:strand:- start:596 stop:1132 length:537 start_codon:yes stop_codon:yes gene_type:complete